MKYFALIASAAALCVGTIALADGHADVDPAVKARQSHMQLYSFNVDVLGNMAQGKSDYDADAAAAAASNLNALANLNQSGYWPAGTDSGAIDGTRALPALWGDFDGVMAVSAEMKDAAAAMDIAAGTDLASLQAAFPALGAACSACHREYRQRGN